MKVEWILIMVWTLYMSPVPHKTPTQILLCYNTISNVKGSVSACFEAGKDYEKKKHSFKPFNFIFVFPLKFFCNRCSVFFFSFFGQTFNLMISALILFDCFGF